jgi:hypothetical protein
MAVEKIGEAPRLPAFRVRSQGNGFKALRISLALLFSFATLSAQERSDMGAIEAGPFSKMSMRFAEKFLFARVDILDLDIQFGLDTARQFEELTSRRNLDAGLTNAIAAVAARSQDAYIRLHFLRDVDLDRFIKKARDNTKAVFEAGLITREDYEEISSNLPLWYSVLEKRGIKKNDMMLYRVKGDSLHIVHRGLDGTVFIDQRDQGAERRLALLGGYFVPTSEFCKSLVNSLVRVLGQN